MKYSIDTEEQKHKLATYEYSNLTAAVMIPLKRKIFMLFESWTAVTGQQQFSEQCLNKKQQQYELDSLTRFSDKCTPTTNSKGYSYPTIQLKPKVGTFAKAGGM